MAFFLCFSDGDKDKVVDILARHCDEKSKLKDFKEKYREKHGQVREIKISPRG